MSLMAANEESDPSAILNGFWVTLVVVLYLVLKECGDEFVGEIDAHDKFQECAYEEADK